MRLKHFLKTTGVDILVGTLLSVSVDRILSAMRLRGGVRLAALFLIWFGILWVGDTIRQSWRSQQKAEDPATRP
jgi:hypothetical protein